MVSIHRPLGYGPSTLPLRHSAALENHSNRNTLLSVKANRLKFISWKKTLLYNTAIVSCCQEELVGGRERGREGEQAQRVKRRKKEFVSEKEVEVDWRRDISNLSFNLSWNLLSWDKTSWCWNINYIISTGCVVHTTVCHSRHIPGSSLAERGPDRLPALKQYEDIKWSTVWNFISMFLNVCIHF